MRALSPDDETYLDGIFDAAVASYGAGKSFDVDRPAAERPHLVEAIARTVAVAREVSFGADSAPPVVPAFPGYELLGEIGRGGAGVVYRARQASVGRVVALKILAPALVPSRRARDRFAAEARALGRLAHPNVVRIHDVVVGDEACALAMEYVAGTTLAEAAANARGGLDLGLVVRVGAAVARALAAVHEAGLVHRDVKPANVVLRGDGAPVLVDFGLARDVGGPAHTATGEFLGTTAFASPEQIRGDRVDHRTDLFALGVTLFVAAAGRPPFRAATAAETLRRIEAGDGETLRHARRGVPEDLCAVVEKALEPDPAHRYATAAEMAEDLERVARWEPVSARRSSWRRRVGRKLRRHRRSAVVAALAAATTLVAASLWIASWRAELALPELFRERVRAARRELVDPDAQMRLFVALNDPGAEALSRGLFATESIDRALASYDAALGLREDTTVRLERETVATAAALLRRDAALRPPPSWTSAAPLAAAVASAWERDRRPGPFAIPPRTTPEDLRCTGLLAYLCSDVAGAIRSWGPLESDAAFDDPLIAAALGSAWLALDRPALAAPRLARAVREFPEAAPLRFDLADALIRVGDLTRGEAELRAAAPYFGDRPAYVRDRLAADLALAKGDRAQARKLYDAAQRSPTTSLHHAAFLASEGEFAEAFERAADAYTAFPRIPRFRRFLLDLLEPAFGALDRSARLDVLYEAAISGETRAPLYAIGESLRRRGAFASSWRAGGGPRLRDLAATAAVFRIRWSDAGRAAPAAARPMLAFALACDEAAPARAHAGAAPFVRARRLLGEPWLAAAPRRGTPWREATAHATAPAAAIFGDDSGGGAGTILLGDPFADGGRGAATVRDVASGDVVTVLRGGEAGAFGRSVAVLGDVDGDGETEAAIGAAGAVRVVGLRGGRMRFEVVEDPASDFGAAVAACGDWDRDGVMDFAAGAPGAGVVACFSGRTGARIRSFSGDAGFGRVLAGGGDADGDGVGDLLIGAPEQTTTHDRWNRTYAEAISGATGATLWTDGNALPDARYGAAVAFVGDLDGDGRDEWCVGEPRNRYPSGAEAGSATIYFGPDGAVRRGLESDPRRFVAFGVAAGPAPPGADGSARFFVGALDPRPATAGLVVEVFRARDFALEARWYAPGRLTSARAHVAVGRPSGAGAPRLRGVFYEDSGARCAPLAP